MPPPEAKTTPAKPKLSLRDAVGLLSGTVLLGLGEKLGERFIPLFLVNLGGGPLAVGMFQAGNNFLGAASALPGGYLSDRAGAKRALQTFAALALLGFIGLSLTRSWPLAVAAAILCLTWTAVSAPAALVLITSVIPARNTAWGVSLHSLVRRVPMALGPLVAGALIGWLGEDRGIRFAYQLAALLAVVALIVQQVLLRPVTVSADRASAVAFSPRRAFAEMSRPLRELLLADTLIRFCEQIPYAFVILWCMREIAHPITALQFGELSAIEMVTAMLIYLPGAWLSGRIGKPLAVTLTFVMFLAFPIVLLFSHSFVWLVVAFVVRGFKELGEPTRKSLILDLCPSNARATYFGWYYLLRDSLAGVGAALGAWLWSMRPAAALWGAAAFGLVGVCWYGWVALREGRQPSV